ncbi:hypothetical protein CH63R_11659 [Colletotrichum higginsianum IMI 349063]|uniref:Uncharacterized protein n=1 Tax=Colletotrichum higginsianum (strain IMI 349063) TaxID=759273 RepID=A0A1B7XYX5_COLHI|nr:hypothetical protein CH63R_11659 [Colletotrichum higginsianum IMI 349063]OBR04956.1 hypothetical protein CH63R_11659 [Colletotrichum higginsianum IMI 349063]
MHQSVIPALYCVTVDHKHSSEFQMFVLRTDGEEDAAWFNKPNLRPNRCNAAQLVRFSLLTSHRHIPDETEIVVRRKLEQITVTRDRQRLEKITRTVSQASGRPSMPNGEYPSSTERNTTTDDGKASQGPILFSLNEPDLGFPMTYTTSSPLVTLSYQIKFPFPSLTDEAAGLLRRVNVFTDSSGNYWMNRVD